MFTEKQLRNFWSKVDKTDACWNWTAYKLKDGYGQFGYNGFVWRAHRLSYFMHKGDPGSKLVCHSCDNPSCVNPEHLFLGNHQDNSKDMVTKKRSRYGVRNVNAKLTDADVINIRNSNKSVSELIKIYNLDRSTIVSVLRRKTWRHV